MAQPGRPDQKLVQNAVRGNRKAFTELFNRYFQAVYNYALTLSHDPALAEDITQEAFIRAHTNLDRLGPPWNFHAWVFRLARNYFIDLTRKERNLDQLEDEVKVISPNPSPERETMTRETSQRVHSTLARLPGRQREILVLRELQGFSYAEIGEIMELSSSNVKVSLHRARAAFQESYGIGLLLEDPSGDCVEVTALLEALHDGEGLLDREHFVKEHLKVCEACRKRRDMLIKQSAILGAFVPLLPPKELAARILGKIPPSTGGSLSLKGGKLKSILGYGGMAGLAGLSALLFINILFNTEKTLPNFPGFNEPQASPVALPDVYPGDPSPTPPISMESHSGPVLPPERCGLFNELDISVVFLNIRKDTMKLPFYYKIEGGVPGFSEELSSDSEPWIYEAVLGGFSTDYCSYQGFDDRLYCLVPISASMAGTYQDLALHLNGCEGPVNYLRQVSVPQIPITEPEPDAPICLPDLNQAACGAAGGIYHSSQVRSPYCECP